MKNKPAIILLYTSLLLFVIYLFMLKLNYSTDIRLHDTYIVVAYSHVLGIILFLSFLLSAVYFIARKLNLSKALTSLHITVTVISILLLVSALFCSKSTMYSTNDSNLSSSLFLKVISGSIIAFVLAQLVLVFNIIRSLFYKSIHQNNSNKV